MKIKFGSAGLGPVKDAVENLNYYHSLGLKACEIAFTYGVYIKNKSDAEKIGAEAKKLGIQLSIHAPYWINLNSAEKEKVEKSKERILKCLEVGTWLGARVVVFHPGYYMKLSKEETYEKIKKEILELQKIRKEKKYSTELAPETTGKINVFGSIEEIEKLTKDTGCGFCIDFSHVLARYKNYEFEEVKKKFGKFDYWHIHFSGIEYGEKGEKHHKETPHDELNKLFVNLPTGKEIVVISESPDPVADSLKALSIYDKRDND